MAAETLAKPRSDSGEWVAAALVHDWSMRLALAAVALSFVLPVEGLGIDLCPFHAQTGWPCPGCGLTRSLTAMSHGDVGRAFELHVFGPAIWALALLLTAANFVGERRREAARRWLRRRHRIARVGYLAFVYGFVAFGVARLVLAIAA